VNKAKFVYVVYIATTPEKVWQALVDGEVTHLYWGHQNVSDWKVGSRWQHQSVDADHDVKIVGRVLESAPPRRLALSWARPDDAANESKHSRVLFEIEPVNDMVKLTVSHTELEDGSDMQHGITEGWPRVLSSLKSYLETGKALDTWAMKKTQRA